MARYFRSPPRVPTSTDVDRCLAALDTEASARDYVLVAMAAWTGLRVHELVALDWSQLVTEAGNVRRRVVLVAEHTKCNIGGDIVVPERLRWRLAQYRTWCDRRGLAVKGDAPVFVSRNGNRISVRRVQQVWKAVQAQVGIDRPYKMHALRHYYGTTMYSTSKDIRLTQVAMRHKSIGSTMIYTHVSERDVETAVDRAF